MKKWQTLKTSVVLENQYFWKIQTPSKPHTMCGADGVWIFQEYWFPISQNFSYFWFSMYFYRRSEKVNKSTPINFIGLVYCHHEFINKMWKINIFNYILDLSSEVIEKNIIRIMDALNVVRASVWGWNRK